MIIRVNFGFHGISSGAPAPVSIEYVGDGFGRLYNAIRLRQNKPSDLRDHPGFAMLGRGRAYLGRRQ